MVNVSTYKTIEALKGVEVQLYSFFKLDATWGG